MATWVVNILGDATVTQDDRENVSIALQVQVLADSAVVLDRVLTIQVPLATDQLMSVCVDRMVQAITTLKSEAQRQRAVAAKMATLVAAVKARVT